MPPARGYVAFILSRILNNAWKRYKSIIKERYTIFSQETITVEARPSFEINDPVNIMCSRMSIMALLKVPKFDSF